MADTRGEQNILIRPAPTVMHEARVSSAERRFVRSVLSTKVGHLGIDSGRSGL
jgi:hypothetical protein